MALSESQSAYRELLSKTAQEAQSDYDKAVLTLSGGALGISVAFVKDIVGAQAAHSWLLIASWVLWGISCASVLVSYYTSGIAFSKEIEDFDKNPAGDRAISVPDVITKLLNAVGGGLFLIGLLCFCWFAAINLSRPMNERADSRTPVEKVDEGQTLPARPTTPSEKAGKGQTLPPRPSPTPPQQPSPSSSEEPLDG